MENGLVVASGLAPRWAAQQPQQTHPTYPRHTEQAGFRAASPPNGGQAPSPQQAPLHISRASHPTVASGLAPRWAAQQPQQTHPSFARHTAQAGFRAASPPNGGQAPSPQQAPLHISRASHPTVASGLAPRWAAQQPQQATPVTPGTPRKQVLGRLRHPTGDKPPLHNKSPLHISRPNHPTVASGLAPRWAAQQPQQTHPTYPRHTAQAGFRAASPPNGGQAPSPQQAPSPHFPPQPPYCGERACPALGCAAAPTNPPHLPQAHRASRF
ncbi:hypothetical protein PS834_04701 [Pseudomonas fluorescens]|nr:hypothetical protein PS834_04701 [Pseudomonas fluorescens]